MLLHCSICGTYLNSGLRLELESKMCFMSKVLGLRWTLQRAPACVSPVPTAGAGWCPGDCGQALVKPTAVMVFWVCTAAPGLALSCFALMLLCLPPYHLSPTFANPTQIPLVMNSAFERFF